MTVRPKHGGWVAENADQRAKFRELTAAAPPVRGARRSVSAETPPYSFFVAFSGSALAGRSTSSRSAISAASPWRKPRRTMRV